MEYSFNDFSYNKRRKVIIIEGLDNIGKDTLISKVSEKFPITTIIHCGKPQSKDSIEAAKIQDELFLSYAEALQRDYFYMSDCIIFNRSHIGEYVYGCMYRERSSKEVENMINRIDAILLSLDDEVYYIQMTSSNIELILRNDDQKSISANDREKVMKERERFEEIFNKSRLNKMLLDVADENGNFRTREEILDDVVKFCNI